MNHIAKLLLGIVFFAFAACARHDTALTQTSLTTTITGYSK